MLPLGRKNARRCTECDITCHANCAHLVPDFCGMSMETANQLLRDWREINKNRGGRPSAPQRSSQPPQHYSYPSGGQTDTTQLSPEIHKLTLTGTPVEPPLPPKGPEYQYRPPQASPATPRMDPRLIQQPLPPAPSATYSPTARPQPLPAGPSGKPPFPTEPIQQTQPRPPPQQAHVSPQPGSYEYQVRSLVCVSVS